MNKTDHPFVVGARVAIEQRYMGDGSVAEDFVAKVHKNGNFTLRGNPGQQWRASHSRYDDPGIWRANRTGDHYDRNNVWLWNDTADAMIRERANAAGRRKRFKAIVARLNRTPPDNLDEAALSAIEAVLPPEIES